MYKQVDESQTLLINTQSTVMASQNKRIIKFGFEDDFLAARLAYVDFKEPKELEHFELHKTCPNVVEGIEKISDWIVEV